MDDYIEIPFEQLQAQTLQAVIEDFIAREGTDYGVREYTLEDKVEQVRRQLQNGTAFIAFDVHTQSCTVLAKE